MKVKFGFAIGMVVLGLGAGAPSAVTAVPLGAYEGREGLSLVVCEEDSCVPLPSPPDDPAPGTLVPGPGNPPVHFPKAKKSPTKKHRKEDRHRGGPRR